MSSLQEIKVNTNQIPVDVLTEGVKDYPAMSKIGQLFTADWKTRLVLAGKCYRMSIGTVSGSGDITLVGTGTTMDLDIPSGIVAIDNGFLVPMELNIGFASLADAASDEVDVLLTVDRATGLSAAEIATATATAETPDNLLDGAEAFSGRAASVATVAITDPVHSDVLHYSHFMGMGVSVVTLDLTVNKSWDYPSFLAGPCTMYLYVYGTIATTFAGSIVFAHIPSAWVPTS
jgi:hypothetical protein